MHTRIVQGYPVQYLKEVTHESFPTYAGFKQKAGYSLPAEEVSRLSEEFVASLHEVLANLVFDEIWVPETSNLAYLSVVSRIAGDKPVYIVRKRSPSEILALLETEPLQKAERAKLVRTISAFTTNVKLAGIAANQRLRIGKLLFEIPPEHGKVVLLDDAIFTGGTLSGILAQCKVEGCFTLWGNSV